MNPLQHHRPLQERFITSRTTIAWAGPLTSGELADRTGLVERCVRESLNGQIVAYVIHSREPNTYLLPDEHAAALADPSQPTYVGGGFTMLRAL